MAIGKIITGQTFGNWLTTTNLMIDEINNASSTFAPGNLVRWGAGGTVVVNTLTATTIRLQGGMTVNAISNNYSTPVDDRTLLTANAIHNLLLDADKTTIKNTPRNNVANTWVTAAYSNVVVYVEKTRVAEFANNSIELTGDTTIDGNLKVKRDLVVEGTRTELSTQTMVVEDNNIQINGGGPAGKDGAGIDIVNSNAFIRLVDTGTDYPKHLYHQVVFNESGSGKLLSYDSGAGFVVRGSGRMNMKDRLTIRYPYPILPAGARYSANSLVLGIGASSDYANTRYDATDPAWKRENAGQILEPANDEVRYIIHTSAPFSGNTEYSSWSAYKTAWANTQNTITAAYVELDPEISRNLFYFVGRHKANTWLESYVTIQPHGADGNINKIYIDRDLNPVTMTPTIEPNPDIHIFAGDRVRLLFDLTQQNTHPIVISRKDYWNSNQFGGDYIFQANPEHGVDVTYRTNLQPDGSGVWSPHTNYTTWESAFQTTANKLAELVLEPNQPGTLYYTSLGNTADPMINFGGRIIVQERNENMGGSILVEYPRGTTYTKTMTIGNVNTANVWYTDGIAFDTITMDAGDTLVLNDIANTFGRWVGANNWIAFSTNTHPYDRVTYATDVVSNIQAHVRYRVGPTEYKDPFLFGNDVNMIATAGVTAEFTPLAPGQYFYFANNQFQAANNKTYGVITVNPPRQGTAGAFHVSTDDKDLVFENPLSFEVTKNHYTTMKLDGELADFSGTKRGVQLPQDGYQGTVVPEGTIRFNQLEKQFEGYANTKWRGLGGGSSAKLIDDNRDTFIQVQDSGDEIHLVTNSYPAFIADGLIADFKGTQWGLQLPVDDNDVRSSSNGVIRYNQSQRMFEGYTSGEWRGLGGVVDLNQDTYIKAGDTDDRLYYVANGANVMQMTREEQWSEANNYSNTVIAPLHYIEKEAIIKVDMNRHANVGEYKISVDGGTTANNNNVISYEGGNTSVIIEPRGVNIQSTGYLQLPIGQEYERPYNAANGMIRVINDGLAVYDVTGNTQAYDVPEIFIDGAWKPLSYITNEMSYTVGATPISNVVFSHLHTPFTKEEIDVYINGLRIQKSDYKLYTEANNNYHVIASFNQAANTYTYNPSLPAVLDRGDKLTVTYDFQNNMNTAPMHIEDDHSGTMASSMAGVEYYINGSNIPTLGQFRTDWKTLWVGNTANIVYTSTFEGVTVNLNSANTAVAANTNNTWWTTGRTSYRSILNFFTPRSNNQIITVEHKPARLIGVNRIDAMSRSELINGFPYRVAFAAGLTVGSGQTSTSTGTGALVINGGVGLSGDLYVGRGVTELSAAGLKTNITDIDSPMDKIQRMHGVEFNWKGDSTDVMRGKEYGLIADEVAKVAPSLVTFENNQPQGVKYSKVVALLIEAMKHQQKEIDELKANMPKKRGRKPKTQG